MPLGELAMDLARGAMGALLPKLMELLKEEYKLQAGLRKDVEFLEKEMRSMDAALRKVAKVPRDQLDEHVKLWADDVRDLSYEMEDVVDRFLIRVEGSPPDPDADSFRGFVRKVLTLFKKRKTDHHIADAIKEIKDQVHEVSFRRDRYKIDDVGCNLARGTTVDPRMLALFKDKREIIGIDGPRDELIEKLSGNDDGVSNTEQPLKMLSIFGMVDLAKQLLPKQSTTRYKDFPVGLLSQLAKIPT
jgi:hypothetical protein